MPLIALPAFVIALLAVLLILGALALAYVASKLVPDVPIIGGWVRNAISAAFNAATSVLRSWCDDAAVASGFLIQGVALTIWWTVYWVVTHAQHLAGILSNLQGQITYVADSTAATAASDLRQALARADVVRQDALTWVGDAERVAANDADGAYTRAAAVAAADYSLARGYAKGLYDQAINYTDGIRDTLKADIATATAGVAGTISGDVAKLEAAINATAAQAVSEVNAAIATAEKAAAGLAATAAAGVTGAYDAAAADLFNPVLGELIGDLRTVVGALPADVAALLDPSKLLATTNVSTLVAALAVLAPAVTAVAAETAECTVPMCANLGGLSSLFGALANDAIWAALLAVAAEAAHDPAAAVSDITEFVTPVVDATSTAFRSAVNV